MLADVNRVAGRGDQGMSARLGACHSSGDVVMGRAILVIAGSAAALLPRPFAHIGHAVAAFWRDLARPLSVSYHPERHYMRGPGPAWRAKHGSAQRD